MKFDILFENGDFWTGNPLEPSSSFLACKDGTIASLGSGPSPDRKSAPGIEIDLHGLFAMPGFIDSHTHFRIGGASLREIDLRNVKSEAQFSDAVRKHAESHSAGEWITGGNWDHESWDSKRLPTKALVDSFTPATPVFLNRHDTHMALVNSYVLRLAGFDRNTPNPPGGIIARDENGEPNGILKDAAREIALKLTPEPPVDRLMDDARMAMGHANSLGVTSVNEIGPERDLNTYRSLKELRELTARIYQVLPISDYSKLIDSNIKVPSGDDWIQVGGLKGFADGSLGAGTAWFFDPYEDDRNNCGFPSDTLSCGKLEKWALEADRNHLQLAFHAIGDRAVNAVLDIFERISGINPPWDRRFRIEHAQHVLPEDFARMKRLNVVASVQPYHCADDGQWALGKIGAKRGKTTYAFNTMVTEGIPMAFGTDWPVSTLSPIEGIAAAVTRETIDGRNPGGWVPEQKISVDQALRAYTQGSAYASFSEGRKGTLEIGKLADMVVLSANPFLVPPESIRDIEILMTVVGGVIVYAADRFSGLDGHNPL